MVSGTLVCKVHFLIHVAIDNINRQIKMIVQLDYNVMQTSIQNCIVYRRV